MPRPPTPSTHHEPSAHPSRATGRLFFAGCLVPLLLSASFAGAEDGLPGARPHPPELRARLERSLASRGPDYVPRTRNIRADGAPRFTNRLLLETSPYLQQHAHNPVDWYPWGDEAFDAAARLGRPVLVSIGYSTCHWCHVMEEESFDDPEVAAYLNQHFIAIKVDREARPDVDAVYMSAVHALNGRGGWPLNVFLTPDRKPFFAGTYFPPRDRGGRPGFSTVLRSIVAKYDEDAAGIAEIADRVSASIAKQLEDVSAIASTVPELSLLLRARDEFTAGIDREWGGMKGRMKFPSSLPVPFLLRMSRQPADSETRRLVELTLDKMAAGGIHDPIGGGFHRYATDPRWLIPHFEKMLYDNALIARAYVEAFEATHREEYAAIARSTLDYVATEMTSSEGGFYSATDADSPTPTGESEEGWFFTWTPDEIESVVGKADAAVVSTYFGVDEGGNLDGRSVLHTWRSAGEVANELATTPAAIRTSLARARPRLYAARAKRPPPFRDEKILAGWNGLMISAFARAGAALAEPERTKTAARAADFVLLSMRHEGRLRRVYKDGRADGPAFLEDYAFLIAGLIDLYEADQNPRWLREAIELQSVLDANYADEIGGGYFKTPNDHERLLAKEKPNRDGAVPAGNSIAAQNLVRLANYTLDERYRERVGFLFSAFHELLARSPTRLPEMLVAVDSLLGTTKEIVLVQPPSGAGANEMREVLRAAYVPNRIVAIATEGEDLEAMSKLVPLVSGKVARGGRTTAYVCEDQVCKFPTSDPEKFAAQLRTESRARD